MNAGGSEFLMRNEFRTGAVSPSTQKSIHILDIAFIYKKVILSASIQ